MVDWAQILVIILSAFLALFLLLSIILVALLIKVTQQIKSVAGSAERTVKKVESTAANLSTFASPLAMGKVISAFVKGLKEK
ncbi:MAG TPA: hypothetical protein PKD19_00880 [Candidatus Saccharibacteria bacterium]|mgnify:CR=1 FL=1|jgi:cell division protein FtsB|nr:hypothetical protein [Candidatus Saccharibacteria bacterium]HMR38214.1 hypothetical protein [Candidatus Saccharibacteria bacterium]